MSFQKYASAEVLSAELAGSTKSHVNKTAHRATFAYVPRPGYLYVRSRAISSRTNDNFDDFPAQEIEKAYRTFIGKPVFVNHHNDDHRRARGVIIDAALHKDANPDGSPDTWVEVLMEVDAIRFPILAKAILAGEIDRTSMGTDVKYSVCTACGNKAETPLDYCAHIPRMKGQRIYRTLPSGHKVATLVAETCYGLGFFENSLLVEDPADPTAFFLGVDDSGVRAMGMTMKAAVENEGLDPKVQIVAKDDYRNGEEWRSMGHPNLLDNGKPGDASKTDNGFDAYADGYQDGVERQKPMSQKYTAPEHADAYWEGYQDGFARVSFKHGTIYRSTLHLTCGDTIPYIGSQPNQVKEGQSWDCPTHGDTTVSSIDSASANSRGLGWDTWGSKTAGAAAVGMANDHVRSFEGRPVPESGDRVAVYRDLSGAPKSGYPAKGSWSIKSLGPAGGRSPHVQAHTIGLHIKDAAPIFDESARQKFKDEAKRGVHAYIGGTVHQYRAPEAPEGNDWEEVSYYPDISHFFTTNDRRKFHGSDEFVFAGGKAFARGNIQKGESVGKSKFEANHREAAWTVEAVTGRLLYVPLPKDPAQAHEILRSAHTQHYKTSDVNPESLDKELISKLAHEGGFSVHVASGVEPHHGYMCSIGNGEEIPSLSALTPERIDQFIGRNKSLLGQPDNVLGGWLDRNNGHVWLDVSKTHPDEASAIRTAKQLGELAIFDMAKGSSVYVNDAKAATIDMKFKAESNDDERSFANREAEKKGHKLRWKKKGEASYIGVCALCGAPCEVSHTGGVSGSATAAPCPSGGAGANPGGSAITSSLEVEAAGPRYADPADHPFFQQYPVHHDNIIKVFDQATPDDFESGKHWYDQAHSAAKLFAKATGKSVHTVAGLISNYSPKTLWPTNMLNVATVLDKGKGVGGKGSGFFASDRQRKVADNLLGGSSYEDELKGPKTRDFAHLIEHGGDKDPENPRAVIDRHALSVATGRRMSDDDLESAPLSTEHYYRHAVNAYKKAADIISERLGYRVHPHQVQATTWLVQQRLNAMADAAHVGNLEKGRTTNNQNASRKWNDYAKERYPDLVMPDWHEVEAMKLALNEVKAPAEVNTLRDEGCPVCGEDDSFNGQECVVCGYIAPPKQFQDPDTSVAQENDLRQDRQDAIDGSNVPAPTDPNKGGTIIVQTKGGQQPKSPTKQKTGPAVKASRRRPVIRVKTSTKGI